jgi:NDP-sugar pyrophosphorylase family protein
VAAFPIRDYWLDVGRLDDFHKADRDMAEGLLD